jgi:hypothetical protein
MELRYKTILNVNVIYGHSLSALMAKRNKKQKSTGKTKSKTTNLSSG